jgi:hypothetical protein
LVKIELLASSSTAQDKTPAPYDLTDIDKAHSAVPSRRVRARQINDADVAEVINLLSRGYNAQRSREFWQQVLSGLTNRHVTAGYPRYGYVLESDGKLVGVYLQIFATVWYDGAAKTRCNLMSLYVEPAYRMYSALFELRALTYKDVTVTDLTALPARHAALEARRYIRYSNGMFIGVPTLSRLSRPPRVRVVEARVRPNVPFETHEEEMLLEHADFGCLSVWCITPDRAYPFIFRARVLKRTLPCVQLIYCRNMHEFARFARPIGLFLARRLKGCVMIDANGPIPGLVGKYFPGKNPRYFHGPDQPQLGDLAYTEIALFGV